MRLAWVTPFARRSAIGRYSAYVVRAMVARGHEVTIICAESQPQVDLHPSPEGVNLHYWRDEKRTSVTLAGADLCIYQVGNNLEFHGGVIALLYQHPGICVFHDGYLLDLFLGWASETPALVARSRRIVAQLYSSDVAARFFAQSVHEQDPVWLADEVPMVEWLAEKSIACVAHSPFYEARLQAACPGPVTVQPLAYDARQPLTGPSTQPRDPLRLLTVGHVNRNKCVLQVIEALATFPELRERYRYDIVGAIEPSMRSELEGLIDSHRLGSSVAIHGEVGESMLQDYLHEADVIANLRWPALEGASASAIEGMLAGKPLIVTDVGFYQTLPEACVLRVRPTHMVADLARHLSQLEQHPEMRTQMGRVARAWATKEFSAELYAERLERLCLDAVPFVAPAFAVRQVATMLSGLGVPALDPLVDRIGLEMASLLSPDGRLGPTTA